MDLILWRHAEAEDGVSDLERALTARGRKQADKIATFLMPRLPENIRILVSPAVRTRQTASALTDRFTLVPDIAPGASSEAVLRAANWPNADDAVLIIGHQPTLGEVAARLLGSSDRSFSIKKGAVWWFACRERGNTPQTTLRLCISPEFL